MKLLSIIGARPQFVKIAPLVRAIDRHNARPGVTKLEHRILHTGQHYDASMSRVFFDELDLPVADFHLGVGSGTHAQQTGAMMIGIERVLEQERPDTTIVYGDTNSTLAGVLAASKLKLRTAHVEAGLRSFDRGMPEEVNRLVADHISDLLLAPTPTAMANLRREGCAERAVSTGDIMYDSVLHYRAQAASTSSVLSRLALEAGGYGVVTLHRAQNTDDPARLKSILRALDDIARDDLPLIFPLHPRTASRLSTLLPNWGGNARLRVVEPLGYLDSLMLLSNARVCLTDSGGLQKEALFVGCPCVTLRSETEWVETLDAQANVLTDGDPARLRAAVAFWKERYPRGGADFTPAAVASFGPGNAAQAILDAIQNISVQESGSPSDAARTSSTGRAELETTGAQ